MVPSCSVFARPLDEVADALIAGGRLTADGDTLALTEAGRRTHAEVASLVEAARARLMRGLTDDDYLRTVTVLDRMTANLTPGGLRSQLTQALTCG
ncbi:hypothetical protein ACFWJW_20150 [Streptomyces sp. NPDC127097]|uniref:hypothetical protein n=1 Tax=Streptomyces sp. NPDC127097 TaxID=3347136 RepID=UPI003655CBAA